MRRQIVQIQRRKYADIWPIDERASKKPENWQGWPEGKRFALVLTHDVDTAKGQEKCYELMQLEEKLGFRSSFNFVPERYTVSSELRHCLTNNGFEVGVHGLYHDGKYFISRKEFQNRAIKINRYLKEWQAVGYRSPSMQYNLESFHDLDIEYDASTFDTDPFEPQPEGMGIIFPFWVPRNLNPLTFNLGPLSSNSQSPQPSQLAAHNEEPVTRNPELATLNSQPATVSRGGYVELPYTLPQDFTLFILLNERNIGIWRKKLDWIAEQGGMALLNIHPDYINFSGNKQNMTEYPAHYYKEFLEYIKSKYEGKYWHCLPKEIAHFWRTYCGEQKYKR